MFVFTWLFFFIRIPKSLVTFRYWCSTLVPHCFKWNSGQFWNPCVDHCVNVFQFLFVQSGCFALSTSPNATITESIFSKYWLMSQSTRQILQCRSFLTWIIPHYLFHRNQFLRCTERRPGTWVGHHESVHLVLPWLWLGFSSGRHWTIHGDSPSTSRIDGSVLHFHKSFYRIYSWCLSSK